MDNILKLTVGCLGVAGLIVMIVPNSDPIAATKAEVVSATPIVSAGTPPPPITIAAAPEDQAAPSEFVVEDYNIGNFGQPMVDPTPPAQRAIIAQQQQMQQQREQISSDQIASQLPIAGANSAGLAGPLSSPPLPGN